MDSKELLKETERAVGGEELLEKHSRLTKDRVEEKKLQQVLCHFYAFYNSKTYSGIDEQSIDNDKTQMENLQSRNAAIEREVTRFLERDAILQQVKVLEMTLPWIQYDKAVADYQASKASRNAAKATFQELQQHERPLRDALKKLKDEAAKMDGQSGALRKAYSNKTMVYITLMLHMYQSLNTYV